MTIGDALRRFRAELNLTQDDVAEVLKVSRQAYHFYERDKANPPAQKIVELARAFDVSADYLLGLSDEPRPVPADKTLAMEINNCRDALKKILSIADKVTAQGATPQ